MTAPSPSPAASFSFLLAMWGLAGALDQPLADEQPQAVVPVRAGQAVQLRCNPEPGRMQPPSAPLRVATRLFRAPCIAPAIEQGGVPCGMPLYLQCVIDKRKAS